MGTTFRDRLKQKDGYAKKRNCNAAAVSTITRARARARARRVVLIADAVLSFLPIANRGWGSVLWLELLRLQLRIKQFLSGQVITASSAVVPVGSRRTARRCAVSISGSKTAILEHELELVLSVAVLVLVIDFGPIHHSEILRFEVLCRSASVLALTEFIIPSTSTTARDVEPLFSVIQNEGTRDVRGANGNSCSRAVGQLQGEIVDGVHIEDSGIVFEEALNGGSMNLHLESTDAERTVADCS